MSTTVHHRGKVLADHKIRELIASGEISGHDLEGRVQPASIDLVLAHGTVWEVAGIPNLTQEFKIEKFIQEYALNSHQIDGGITLQRGRVYILGLNVTLQLKRGIHGFANPKSSTGRIDAHAIVIGDGAKEFNVIPEGFEGQLYLILVPQSFPVQVRAGDSLAQLRLFDGKRNFLDGLSHLKKLHKELSLVHGSSDPMFTHEGVMLHLDLKVQPSNLVANRVGKPVDMAARKSQDPRPFFREKLLDDNGNLILEPDERQFDRN